MDHDDVLDVAEAMLLEPLRDHPEEMRKFREEHLYAPLPGTRQAKKRASLGALAAMGVDPKKVRPGMGLGKLSRSKSREKGTT